MSTFRIMSELHFKIIFAVLWIAYIAVRVPHEKNYKRIERKKVIGEKKERLSIFILLTGVGILPWLWILSPWLDSLGMNIPIAIRAVGIVAALFSIWLFWWVHKTLGLNWSPILEIRKEHELIKNGPYKYIRHPMYTQIWIWAISQFLIISNWVAGVAGIALWAIMYFMRVGKEEQMMVDEFGEEYEQYMSKTGRVLPKLF